VVFLFFPDKDGNGSVDMEELKLCLQELQVEYSDEEIEEFHHESDMDSSHGIQFKEFIVVLALIYLLGRPTHTGAVSSLLYLFFTYHFNLFESGLHSQNQSNMCLPILLCNLSGQYFQEWILTGNQKSAIGLPDLEATFDEIVEAFVFFDRNKDGYVSKKEMIYAINEASPGRQGSKIGVQRFGHPLPQFCPCQVWVHTDARQLQIFKTNLPGIIGKKYEKIMRIVLDQNCFVPLQKFLLDMVTKFPASIQF
jgi:Ca2+-binding EF-hand superfamily protein